MIGCLLWFENNTIDSVSQGLLLHKLHSFGFEYNLVVLIHFFFGVKQVMKVDGCFSSKVVMTSGFSQGSMLSPLLFIISLTLSQTQYNTFNICFFQRP